MSPLLQIIIIIISSSIIIIIIIIIIISSYNWKHITNMPKNRYRIQKITVLDESIGITYLCSARRLSGAEFSKTIDDQLTR